MLNIVIVSMRSLHKVAGESLNNSPFSYIRKETFKIEISIYNINVYNL